MSLNNSKIVLCNLESYVSSDAVQYIIEKLHPNIMLIVTSNRFSGKHGSFFMQFFRNIRHSGLFFTQFLALNFIYFLPFRLLHNILHRNKPRKFSLHHLARKHGIPWIHAGDINDPPVIARIRSVRPDILLSFQFDQIIRKELISIPSVATINVHASLLPKCRGPFPVFCSLLNNERVGVTIHIINDEQIDMGKIVVQKEIIVNKKESVLGMKRIIYNEGARLLVECISHLEKKIFQTQNQEGNGYYFPFPTKSQIQTLKKRKIRLLTFSDLLSY